MQPYESGEAMKDPTEIFKQASLEALRNQLAVESYPGYPKQRLVLSPLDIGPITKLPEGPWEFYDRPPLPAQAVAHTQFYDQHNRPLHPWFADMATDPRLGLITGTGKYWHWGPNFTADPIITRQQAGQTEVLLIKRGDTGHWALPGGFVDSGEDPLTAAVREAAEETGLDISQVVDNQQSIYQGPLADIRVTAHAWPHTFAYHFDVTGLELGEPQAGDDAKAARWFTANQLTDLLFGSHALLIARALGE